MERRDAIIWLGWVFLLGAVLIANGCSRTGEPGSQRTAAGEESTMKTETPTRLSPGEIPPIDAAAPETFETATFGLG